MRGGRGASMALPRPMPRMMPRRGPAPAPVPAWLREKIFAGSTQVGDYFVSWPTVADVQRLRSIEREFVFDHKQLFLHDAWAEVASENDWYRIVNVIGDEAQALSAISRIVAGRGGQHATLQVQQVHGALEDLRQSPIVGYVHFVVSDHLNVSHLKVTGEHRGQGLGALLLAGMVRYVELAGHGETICDMRLVVMSRNEQAQQLYDALGFEKTGARGKQVGQGSKGRIEWTKMSRISATSPEQTVQDFLAQCESRRAERSSETAEAAEAAEAAVAAEVAGAGQHLRQDAS